jgi:hypothetical protein
MNLGRLFTASALGLAIAGPAALAVTTAGAEPAAVTWMLAAPWADPDAVVDDAGGRLAGPRQPRLGRLAYGEGDFGRRLRQAGAWLVVANPRILAICGVSP